MGVSIPRNGETMEQCLTRRRAEWAVNAKANNEQRRADYHTIKDESNRRRREQEALNRDKVRLQLRESYARNAASRCESAIYNHHRRKLRVPSWSEREAIREFYKHCPKGHEVDHAIPLLGEKVSGLHVLANLQYLPMEKNRAKRNSYEVS